MASARWTLLLIPVAVVAYAQLAPSPGDPGPLDDTTVHFGMYAAATVLAALAAPPSWGGPQERLRVVTSGMLILGILLEVGQAFVPQRTFEVADLAANMLGCISGWGFAATMVVGWPQQPPRQDD